MAAAELAVTEPTVTPAEPAVTAAAAEATVTPAGEPTAAVTSAGESPATGPANDRR